jgi:hypothetical protein
MWMPHNLVTTFSLNGMWDGWVDLDERKGNLSCSSEAIFAQAHTPTKINDQWCDQFETRGKGSHPRGYGSHPHTVNTLDIRCGCHTHSCLTPVAFIATSNRRLSIQAVIKPSHILEAIVACISKLTNSVAWVRERIIPTERSPLVGEVSANFWG